MNISAAHCREALPLRVPADCKELVVNAALFYLSIPLIFDLARCGQVTAINQQVRVTFGTLDTGRYLCEAARVAGEAARVAGIAKARL